MALTAEAARPVVVALVGDLEADAWKRSAPAVRRQHLFFRDTANTPAEARRQILSYLGADPAKSDRRISPNHNQKAKAAKLAITEDTRQVLVQQFRNEHCACAALYGGHALTWKANHGV